MAQTRQLAAIMFTDIVGYTVLMGNDEQKAFDFLTRNRSFHKPIIEQFNGRWIKEMGDGVMASFNTVSDAVQAAIKIQEACNQANEFQLRIGIHLGEVVFENGDVFGDGVNIAARIQSAARPGSIYVSESVQQNVSNKPGIETRFINQEVLKNVKEPIRVYEVLFKEIQPESLVKENKENNQSKVKNISDKSIAVLPFENMSSDPEQEYFSDGMTEEILNALSHLKDLKVAGRTSSFQFKGKNIDLLDVGKKLQVRTVLKGSVRKQGNRIRITAQLINVEDGFQIWSEKYDRDLDDIFEIQDEIALAITDQLKVKLFEKDREAITKNPTQNVEAYKLYLKGRFYTGRRGSSIIAGLHYFKQAIAADPGFAGAYCAYAGANTLIAFYSFSPGKEVLKEVKQAAETAERLDNSLGEAYCSLAICYEYLEWNWVEAKKHYIRAIELSPRSSQIRSLYAMSYLSWVEGKFDEAEMQAHMAINLEPLSAIDHADLSSILYTANKFEEALTYAKTGIELDANSFLSQRLVGLCYMALKRYEEAIDSFENLMKISNGHQHAANSLIWAYCNSGNVYKAGELMNELVKRSATEYIAGTYLGISAAYLNDLDTALNYLERAYEDRDPTLITLKYLPAVPSSLRIDLRFQNLLDRIGFPK